MVLGGTPSQLSPSLSSSLLSHLYFPILSAPLPSFTYFLTFFLPSLVFPPSLLSLPCQFNLPVLCLAFPGSRCQASNLPDFTPGEAGSEQLVQRGLGLPAWRDPAWEPRGRGCRQPAAEHPSSPLDLQLCTCLASSPTCKT